MAMTLKVYEVDRYNNTVRVVREEAPVVPRAEAEASSVYPACKCSRCDECAKAAL